MLKFKPKHLLTENILSPWGLAIASYLIFMIGIVFPSRLYSELLHEEDLMYMNIKLWSFYTLCVVCFLLGVYSVNTIRPVQLSRSGKSVVPKCSATIYLLVPLLPLLTLSIFSMSRIFLSNPYYFLLLAQDPMVLRNSLELQDSFGSAITMLMGATWWAWWRYGQLTILSRAGNFTVIVILLCSSSVLVLNSFVKLARYELIPVVIGFVLIYLLHKLVFRCASYVWVLRGGLFSMAFIVALFNIMTVIRSGDNSEVTTVLLGYTIASYNRLAALIDGLMYYSYGGKGIYLINFLGYTNSITKIVPFNSFLGWPDYMECWSSEFSAVGGAMLNQSYNWGSAFGYIYSELGWFSPVYLFIIGIMYGVIWYLFKKGGAFGLVLYPWFAFNLLFWFGSNLLLEPRIVWLLVCALIISIYESFILRKIKYN